MSANTLKIFRMIVTGFTDCDELAIDECYIKLKPHLYNNGSHIHPQK